MSIPKYFLGLDVETSGQSLRHNFMIQIGLSLINTETYEVINKFSSYISQPNGTVWEERCVKEFWSKYPDQWERAKNGIKNAPDEIEVSKQIMEFIGKCPQNDICLVVDTPGFDISWFDLLISHQDKSHLYIFNDKYNDAIEVSSWYLGTGFVCDPNASSKKTILNTIQEKEFPKWSVVHDHNAANDATVMVLNLAWIMRQKNKKK